MSDKAELSDRARKASGRPKGPGKSKLDPFRPEIEALLANGSTRKFIAKRYNTTPANLSNWMNKNGGTKSKLRSTGCSQSKRPETRWQEPTPNPMLSKRQNHCDETLDRMTREQVAEAQKLSRELEAQINEN